MDTDPSTPSTGSGPCPTSRLRREKLDQDIFKPLPPRTLIPNSKSGSYPCHPWLILCLDHRPDHFFSVVLYLLRAGLPVCGTTESGISTLSSGALEGPDRKPSIAGSDWTDRRFLVPLGGAGGIRGIVPSHASRGWRAIKNQGFPAANHPRFVLHAPQWMDFLGTGDVPK
jgi:hypothetical protein